MRRAAAARVAGPTTPSTAIPAFSWNTFVAASVRGPKLESREVGASGRYPP